MSDDRKFAVSLFGKPIMSGHVRIPRQQIIREVEGYLELVELFPGEFEAQHVNRERLALRALELLEKVDGDGSRLQFLILKGTALRALERHSEAVVALHEASQLDAETIHVWLMLGWCHKRNGRVDLAIESLEEALRVDPSEAILHYNLACYWSLLGNCRRAVSYLSHALQIDPNYRDLIDGEHDFDPIRHHPEFQAVTNAFA